MTLSKIISGGQTGVDRGAIEAAFDIGFEYGGLVPKGRLAEDGIVPLKFDKMTESTREDYLFRTERNVIDSDATLILNYSTNLNGGTLKTKEFCDKHHKPCLVWDLYDLGVMDYTPPMQVMFWLEDELEKKPIVLNVAGPRESKRPGIQAVAKEFVKELIEMSVVNRDGKRGE